jgi:hypothetical protein
MPRANKILPHHRFPGSLGYPLAHVLGTIDKVFASPENHHGANHQQFTITVTMVLNFQGGSEDISGQAVFVAVRFGDSEGLDSEIPDLSVGNPIEIQGEYIDSAQAYPTQDNVNPTLPVLHYTHHPVGFIKYEGTVYS